MRASNSSFLILTTLLCVTSSYKILGIFPHTGRSHFFVFEPLLKALVEKGHELTVISPFPQKEPLERYHDISLNVTSEATVGVMSLGFFSGYFYERYLLIPLMLSYKGYDSCEKTLSSKAVQDLISSNELFDLIITEYFDTDCFLGFVHKFQVPFVATGSCTLMSWLNPRFGNPDNPSYIPDNLMSHGDHMTFLDRVDNTFGYLVHRIISYLLMEIPANIVARKYFGDDLPSLNDIAYNTSIMLENTHFSLNLPRPQVPNIIDVGGIHIRNVNPLPQVIYAILFVDCTALLRQEVLSKEHVI